MLCSKVLKRVSNFSADRSRVIFRSLQHKNKSTVFLSSEAPRVENDTVHKTLEGLPAYENHVLPSPKSCQEYINSQVSSGSCNCMKKCRLSKMPRSGFMASKPNNVTGVSEFVCHEDRFSVQECEQKSTDLPLMENKVECFKWQNFEQLLLAWKMNHSRLNEKLSMNLQVALDQELTQIMIHISLWPSKQVANFEVLKNILDRECCKRHVQWSVEHQFYVADIWYHLNRSRICTYNSEIIKKMSEKLNTLTKCQLIHLLFLISLRRKVNLNLMLKIEKFLENEIDSFSAEELVVIAMAYFKTSTKITSSVIILALINELNQSFATMNMFQLTCIVKALRYSYRFENKHLIEDFLKRIAKDGSWKNNFTPAAHLCLLAHSHNLYVPELLDKVIKDMVECKDVRLKDIAKLLMTASKFDHSHPNILNSLSDFCRNQFSQHSRQQEINRYFQHYISSLLSLSYMGIFIHEELHRAFSDSSTKLAHDFSRELAALDCITEIDEPLYSGNRLSVEERHGILQKIRLYYSNSKATKTLREKITMDLSIVLQELFNKELPLIHVLPHMGDPVFLLVFDGIGQLSEPTEEFMRLVSKGCIAKPTNEHSWVVIWPITRKEMFSKTEFVGFSLVKEKHFTKLGFKLIKVPVDVSSDYERSKSFLQESLKCFLQNT